MPRSDTPRTWHLITGEYPPDSGGVADYSATVAHALVNAGDRVHVWTAGVGETSVVGGVTLHPALGTFTRLDLARAARQLDRHAESARILLQWVPHAFGRRGVNIRFARWLHDLCVRRAGATDVMVHEPFVPFAGSAAQRAAAAVQRLMTALVLRPATRVFVGTPAWTKICRPWAGRRPFAWTPIPSGVPVFATEDDRERCRHQFDVGPKQPLIGCFGRAGSLREHVVEALARTVINRGDGARVLLVGSGSEALAGRLIAREPGFDSVLRATGFIDGAAVSAALRACDVMVQPYPDGVCTRHSSTAALLAHARPVVTNAGRFTEELWADAKAVALVPTAEPSALVAAACRLLRDHVERQRLSRAAAALYASRFDVRHTVAALQG
jgi:glycosyltransferase involved in cell wall biosynthesis